MRLVLPVVLIVACAGNTPIPGPGGGGGGATAGGATAGGATAGGSTAGGATAGGATAGGATAGGGSAGGSTLCSGVQCVAQSTCDPATGYCKCNGIICQGGETCRCPTGQSTCAESAKSCVAGSACTPVTCSGGTTCDPADGLCKCGGPGGPVCASMQICQLGPPAVCQGGTACTMPCAGGTSCDPADGICKCGGAGGLVCQTGDICVTTPLSVACRRPCDVRAPACAAGTYCWWDSLATTPASYCAPPSGMQPQDAACTTATACFSGNPARAMHCNGLALGQTGICRPYCDTAAGTAGCLQVPIAQVCVQINGAPAGYGYCQP